MLVLETFFVFPLDPFPKDLFVSFHMVKMSFFVHHKEALLWYKVRVHMRLQILNGLRKAKGHQVKVQFGLSSQHCARCSVSQWVKRRILHQEGNTSHNMEKMDNDGNISYCSYIRTNVSMLEWIVTCNRNVLSVVFGNAWGWANLTSNHNDYVNELAGVAVLSGLRGRIEMSFLNSELTMLTSVIRGPINPEFLACPPLVLDADTQDMVHTLTNRAHFIYGGTIYEIHKILYTVVPDARTTRSGKLTITLSLVSLLNDSVSMLSHDKVLPLPSPHPRPRLAVLSTKQPPS